MNEEDKHAGQSTEATRLAALYRLKILDTPPDERFDRIARLAANHFAAPVAKISFLDEDRTWFKSSVGMQDTQASRQVSFCSTTIENPGVLVVPDLTKDPRFNERPQVKGGQKFRFYAGAPIGPNDGNHVGTLCIMDHVPRLSFSEEDACFLADLAQILNDELANRASLMKRAEELNAQEERFTRAMQSANEGLWDWDLVTNEVYYSPRWCSMLGYDDAEIIPSLEGGWASLVDAEHRDRVLGLVDQYMAGEIAEFETEFPMRHKDGHWVWIRSRAFLMEENGRPVRLIGTHVDVTEHKRLEETLRQAQKMEAVGQLTGGVAHDFNNLLGVIVGNAEILKLEFGDNEYVDTILKSADRGKDLTGRLLSFSRKQPLNPKSTDLQALVTGMVDLLSRSLGEPFDVSCEFEPGLSNVHVDASQMENAIVNLAVNARDAMPTGGTLQISVRNLDVTTTQQIGAQQLLQGSYVEVAITDEGSGMNEAVVAQAFEPFFTTKGVGKGSGLGLSMVYGFAQQSGGAVTIESMEGKGTTVRLLLPTTENPVENAPEEKIPMPHDGRGQRVLVLEDDSDIRSMCEHSLQNLGYEPVVAGSLADAEQAFNAHNDIRIVLSDVVLADGTTGPEYLANKLQSHPDLKIVFMSGYPDIKDEYMKGPLRPNLLNVLSKPFRRSDLAAALEGIDS